MLLSFKVVLPPVLSMNSFRGTSRHCVSRQLLFVLCETHGAPPARKAFFVSPVREFQHIETACLFAYSFWLATSLLCSVVRIVHSVRNGLK